MALNLTPEDQAEYRRRSALIEHQKQLAIAYHDPAQARCCRQAQGALYDEYKAKELPPEPPTAWEVEMERSLEYRVDRIEQALKLGRYSEEFQ